MNDLKQRAVSLRQLSFLSVYDEDRGPTTANVSIYGIAITCLCGPVRWCVYSTWLNCRSDTPMESKVYFMTKATERTELSGTE